MKELGERAKIERIYKEGIARVTDVHVSGDYFYK